MRRGELGLRAEKLVCGEAALAPYRKALEVEADSAGCILHVSARNQKPAPDDVAGHGSGVGVLVRLAATERTPPSRRTRPP